MKIYPQAVLILSMVGSITSLDLSKESVEQVATGKCKTHINFDVAFTKADGSKCESCGFCEGSKVSSLYDPKAESTCIACASPEDECTTVSYTTDFDVEWTMPFFELLTSKKDKAYDPQRVIVKAISSSDEEDVLYDASNFMVDERGSKITSLIANSNAYKRYVISFVRKATSQQMHLGHYGIVQVYTGECGTSVLKELGLKILPSLTNAPTNPPTIALSDSPSVLPVTFLLKALSNNKCMYYDTHGDAYGGTCDGRATSLYRYNTKTGYIEVMGGKNDGKCLRLGTSQKAHKVVTNHGCKDDNAQIFEFIDGKVKNKNNKCLQYLPNSSRFQNQACVTGGNELFERIYEW